MIQLKFGDFVVSFSPDIKHETYENFSYRGVIFYDENGKYDVIYHHTINWNRMIVNYPAGSYKDLPFHEGTFRFLPECVKVERNK